MKVPDFCYICSIMDNGANKYGLDFHCTMILEEYRASILAFKKIQEIVMKVLRSKIDENKLYVTGLESRIKEERSLAGKLELKGHKYQSLSDITDIFGARVITFYTDEVDKISSLVSDCFTVDWENSVDKRKMHQIDSFGYNSLHYICSIPPSLYQDPALPEINKIRFEIQMRTALQHVWSTINHDTGYKSGFEIPREYIRSINCLAGMLEMADNEFSHIRTSINEYRRKVENLVSGGHFEEVPLDGDSFKSYMGMNPLQPLVDKIAAINQAEIYQTSVMPYLEVLRHLGFKTLKDLDNLVRKYKDDAYRLAVFQLGRTDLDIIASSIGLQNLLISYIIKNGGGETGIKNMFDILEGESEYNASRAKKLMEFAAQITI